MTLDHNRSWMFALLTRVSRCRTIPRPALAAVAHITSSAVLPIKMGTAELQEAPAASAANGASSRQVETAFRHQAHGC